MSKIKLIIFIFRYRGIKWIKTQHHFYKKDRIRRDICAKMSFIEYLEWTLSNEPCGA